MNCNADVMPVEMNHRTFLAQDYAIINPMQVPSRYYEDIETIRLLPVGLERHQRLAPLLLALKPLSDQKRLELLERSDRWAKCHDMPFFSALLKSDLVKEVVQSRLVHNMILPRPDGRRTWLRFHDPRIFRHLCWLLDAAALRSLMNMVTNWVWYDPEAFRWYETTRPELKEPVNYRLRLSSDQWAAVDQLEALNRCLRQMASERIDVSNAANNLMAGLLHARQQSLTDIDDAMLYAKQYWRKGSDWHRQSLVAHCIDLARCGTSTYYSACAENGLL